MTAAPDLPAPLPPTPFDGAADYRTDPGRKPPWAVRLCPSPSLAFYTRALALIRRGFKAARADRYDDGRWVADSLDMIRYLEDVGGRFTVEGLDRIGGLGGPAVYVANHMSTLETFALPAILRPRGPVTFVVKQSLLDYPWFGPILRSRNPIAVGRANPREDLVHVLDEGRARLAAGVSVVVFPQTTRMAHFDPARFNSIGAKLAARAGVALAPLALKTDIWPTHRWLRGTGPLHPERPVRFRFGDPLPPAGKGDEAHRASSAFIAQTLAAWEAEG